MYNFWMETNFVKLSKAFIENFPYQNNEVHLVIRALYYFLAFVLMVISISGFTIYVWHLNRSDNNTSRLLNKLYGFMALNGIYISLHKFTHLVLSDYFSETNPNMCLFDVTRVFVATLTNLIISMTSVALILRQFLPQKYLDLSDRWSNKVFGIVIMAMASLNMIRAGKTCDLCHPDCTMNEIVFTVQVCLPLSVLGVVSVMIDSVWGCAQIFNMVRNLFSSSNEVTPVIEFSPTNETPTVNFTVCIKQQVILQ